MIRSATPTLYLVSEKERELGNLGKYRVIVFENEVIIVIEIEKDRNNIERYTIRFPPDEPILDPDEIQVEPGKKDGEVTVKIRGYIIFESIKLKNNGSG